MFEILIKSKSIVIPIVNSDFKRKKTIHVIKIKQILFLSKARCTRHLWNYICFIFTTYLICTKSNICF